MNAVMVLPFSDSVNTNIFNQLYKKSVHIVHLMLFNKKLYCPQPPQGGLIKPLIFFKSPHGGFRGEFRKLNLS
jgi:hypothetical protein